MSYMSDSVEKGDFLKTTMWHLGVNRGSIIFHNKILEYRSKLSVSRLFPQETKLVLLRSVKTATIK